MNLKRKIRVSIRTLLILVSLCSVALALCFAKFSYTISVSTLMFTETGDTIDVFAYPPPSVNTEGGFDMARIIRDATIQSVDRNADGVAVTIRLTPIEILSAKNSVSGYWINKNPGDRETIWVD